MKPFKPQSPAEKNIESQSSTMQKGGEFKGNEFKYSDYEVLEESKKAQKYTCTQMPLLCQVS